MPAWDVSGDAMPGQAGSGLIGCIGLLIIPALAAVAIGLLIVEGTAGVIIAALEGVVWLLFTVGATWQVIEMRRAGGYTRIPPP